MTDDTMLRCTRCGTHWMPGESPLSGINRQVGSQCGDAIYRLDTEERETCTGTLVRAEESVTPTVHD